MKIREIHCNRWLLQKQVAGITLYPFIFYNKKSLKYNKDFEALQFHEFVHVDQVCKNGWFKFYLDYLWQSFRFGYRSNKYEIEAFDKEHKFVKNRGY